MIHDMFTVGGKTLRNRVVFQPMEGCDCREDGAPGELTCRKYDAFFASGAGVVWLEANAVTPEGRTNVRQMHLHAGNADIFKRKLDEWKELAVKTTGAAPFTVLQLTHSGRQSIVPQILYHNAVYEKTRPLGDENILSDEYLDALPEKYAAAACLAEQAGFDAVDVKSCHGYLLQEALSAYERRGKYGGDFCDRTRLFLSCVDAVRAAVTHTAVVSRLGVSDAVPKPYGFGTDEKGDVDLTETVELIQKLYERGVRLINVTIGNPYYNPHVNRPFRAGPYTPPETPQTGLQRFFDTTKALKTALPHVAFVQSGFSYYGKDMLGAAERQLQSGVCDLVGFGRQTLAYPQFYRDFTAGKFDGKKCCVACSKCTSLMRGGYSAGCAVFDPAYRQMYREMTECNRQK